MAPAGGKDKPTVWEVKGMEQPFRRTKRYYEEDDFYSEQEREMLLENDEISASEEAFMRGYDDA